MFRAIIFDLGKVIVPIDMERGFRAIQACSPYPLGEIPSRIRSAGLVERFETGRISADEFRTRFSATLGLKLEPDRFRDLWCSIFLPEPLIPERLLEGLARRYRLLLLSNTNALHFEMIRENYPLLKHFHHFILSYEVGAAKPDRAIYQAAITCADCSPQECFFTDDVASYVEGARRLGIDAVQFESASQVEQELRTRGVAWD